MARINTVSWLDGEVLTRLMHSLQEELMSWQKFADRDDPNNPGMSLSVKDIKTRDGDSSVLVAAINLKTKLDEIIERSRKANGW